MVPCSRSRTTAAPARMMASMVMLLMTAITLVNQAVVRFGLKAMLHIEIYRRQRHPLGMGEEIGDLGGDDLLGIAGAEPGLHHRGRIDVDLQPGLLSGQHIAFEIRRDIDHEGITSRCSSQE